MKKYITMFAVILAFGIAKAQDSTTSETPDTSAPTTSEAPVAAPHAHAKARVAKHAAKAEKQHPCAAIKKACEAAGFHKGEHKKDGKGLYKDCLEPTLAGTPPAGVTATDEEINACKAHKANEKHEEHGQGKHKGHGKMSHEEHHEDAAAPAPTTTTP